MKITESQLRTFIKECTRRIISEAKSKRTLINQFYRMVHPISQRIFRDDAWQNVHHILDEIGEWSDENTQILDFGVNLTDYTETDDSSSLATYVVPMGASMSSTDYDYNDGYFVTSDASPVKGKEYYTRASQFYGYRNLASFDYGISYYELQESTGTFVITSDATPDSNKIYYIRHSNYSICPEDLTAFETGVTYYEYNEDNDESNLSLTLEGYPDNYLNSTEYINKGDMIYSVDGVKKYGSIKTLILPQKVNCCDMGLLV